MTSTGVDGLADQVVLVVKIIDVVEDEDVVAGRNACSREGLRCPRRCSADRCVRLWHVLRRPEAGTKKVTWSQVI
jgi:hypothetical protein